MRILRRDRGTRIVWGPNDNALHGANRCRALKRRAAQGSDGDQADLRALAGAGTLTAFTATSVAAAMLASAISATWRVALVTWS